MNIKHLCTCTSPSSSSSRARVRSIRFDSIRFDPSPSIRVTDHFLRRRGLFFSRSSRRPSSIDGLFRRRRARACDVRTVWMVGSFLPITTHRSIDSTRIDGVSRSTRCHRSIDGVDRSTRCHRSIDSSSTSRDIEAGRFHPSVDRSIMTTSAVTTSASTRSWEELRREARRAESRVERELGELGRRGGTRAMDE